MKTFRYLIAPLALILALVTPPAFSASYVRADLIQQQLHNDPAFAKYYIQVDTFGGLAVLHGWVLHRSESRAIADRVKQMDGIDYVYNYIISDDVIARNDPHAPVDVARTANKSHRVQVGAANMNDGTRDLGIFVSTRESALPNVSGERDDGLVEVPVIGIPDTAAAAVKTNLTVDPITSLYNIRVDSYAGIIFLHGWVPTDKVAWDVEQIAARTPGIRQVVSYLTVTEETPPAFEQPFEVALFHPDDQPKIEASPAEPVYVRYQEQPSECR